VVVENELKGANSEKEGEENNQEPVYKRTMGVRGARGELARDERGDQGRKAMVVRLREKKETREPGGLWGIVDGKNQTRKKRE